MIPRPALTLLTFCCSAAAAVPPAYQLTEIPLLPGAGGGQAYGINDAGQVVGGDSFASGSAFLWDHGTLSRLPSPDGLSARAYSINEFGQVVGAAEAAPEVWQPFLYSGGTFQYLIAPSQTDGAACSINDAGQIVGLSVCDGTPCGFLWQAGIVTKLQWPQEICNFAYGINNRGQIACSAWEAPANERVYLWDNGVKTPLPDLGQGCAEARAINEAGQLVGSARAPDGNLHAVLWRDGTIHDLGTLPGRPISHARAINDVGQIVGNADIGAAVLWDDGTIIDLNALIPSDSGWLLTDAYGINNRGQIVGGGIYDDQPRAFILTPIPEPAAGLLLTLAAPALLARRSLRRSRSQAGRSVPCTCAPQPQAQPQPRSGALGVAAE